MRGFAIRSFNIFLGNPLVVCTNTTETASSSATSWLVSHAVVTATRRDAAAVLSLFRPCLRLRPSGSAARGSRSSVCRPKGSCKGTALQGAALRQEPLALRWRWAVGDSFGDTMSRFRNRRRLSAALCLSFSLGFAESTAEFSTPPQFHINRTSR